METKRDRDINGKKQKERHKWRERKRETVRDKEKDRGNESEYLQKLRVRGEYMWTMDVLSNHKCQM